MEGLAAKVVFIIVAATVGEAINEFLFMPIFDLLKGRIDEGLRTIAVRLWSGLVGVGLALEFGLGLFALLDMQAFHPWADQVVTGLLIGRGSNYVHELVNKLVAGTAKRLKR